MDLNWASRVFIHPENLTAARAKSFLGLRRNVILTNKELGKLVRRHSAELVENPLLPEEMPSFHSDSSGARFAFGEFVLALKSLPKASRHSAIDAFLNLLHHENRLHALYLRALKKPVQIRSG